MIIDSSAETDSELGELAAATAPTESAQQFVSVGARTASWVGQAEATVADGWYRGDTIHFYPNDRDCTREAEPGEIDQHVMLGWAPADPVIDKQTMITAFGSCFARHVENYLRVRGYKTSISVYGDPENSNYWGESLIIKCGEGFVNTFALRTQFEWVFSDKMPELRVWRKAEGTIREYIDANKQAAREIFYGTGCFIITLGLSEVWYNKQTGQVLWTAVPKREFDPDVHGFKVSTVAENLENLRAIVDLIRRHRGDVPIVFTLSPVHLAATFRPVSCITASAVSKAILRVAVDELMRERVDDKRLFYFPSYEMVTGYVREPWAPDRMHPHLGMIEVVMNTFERHYCVKEASPEPAVSEAAASVSAMVEAAA